MTDDLEEYEKMAGRLRWESAYSIQRSIRELITMVREARKDAEDWNVGYLCVEKRAEAAERELSELKRKMQEPDEEMLGDMTDNIWPHISKDVLWKDAKEKMRATWIAGAAHLLGKKE